ncbi:MAG: helix-turn-helix transcriptional regulator [Bryobacteraceae bacterium]|nr:helix-turn-helix transcriptional regulator [Bryobacteraceae bacterium]
MNATQLRQTRIGARISGDILSARAGIDRSRLSRIESGHLRPSDDEIFRIQRALEALVTAREGVAKVAAECGWPLTAL